MKIMGGQLFILLIICLCHSSYAIDVAYDTGKKIWKLYSIIDEMTSNSNHDGNGLLSNNTEMNGEIRNQLDQIYSQLDGMDKFMDRRIILDSFNSWTSSIALYKYIDTLELFVSSIDGYYLECFHQINETNYHSKTLQQLMKSLVPHIVDKILVIRKNVIEANQLLLNQQNLPLRPDFCDGPQIISNVLVQLFRMVIVAEMKAHIMFAISRICQLPQSTVWINILSMEQFERQFGTYVNLFVSMVELTETVYLRACDPVGGKWIRDKSFYELEGTFQTAIFGYNWKRCEWDSCNDVWFKKSHECNAQYYNDRSSCSTVLTECAWLHAIQACVSKSGPYKFKYINSTELGLLGMTSKCTSDVGYIIEDGMSWDLSHASCICNCDGNHNKISLLIMKSNVKLNRVITGLRFVRKNQILHIQPREGKLGADGYIYPFSQRWLPIKKDLPKSQIHSVDRENRVFFFDDVRLPAGFVLTGVKFNKVKRGNVTGFAIEIFGAPFDYNSGTLNPDIKFMVSRQASNKNPGQPLVFEARSSVLSTRPHTVSPIDMKYVALERSNLRADAGQSTLPLFDAVPIHPNIPSVLGGIGIFHKGDEGFAGFISLRVYGIKYAAYFTDFEFNYMKNGRVSFNHSQYFL